MNYEIRNRFSNNIIYQNEADSFAALVQAAIKSGADLRGADLRGAYLRGADLRGAYLRGANLQNADLRGADLRGANLQNADLQNADLRGANLQNADLQNADLRGANGLHSIVPEEGSFVAFKKTAEGAVIKLLIPEDAERLGGFIGRKCRASKAIVLSGNGHSRHNESFEYKEGQTITPDSWDPDPRVECSHGIHFFISRKEAEQY